MKRLRTVTQEELPYVLRDWRLWIGDSVIYLNQLSEHVEKEEAKNRKPMARIPKEVDDRYAKSIACTWHGPIAAVGSKTVRGPRGAEKVPCCPHCNSLLVEADAAKWSASIEACEIRGPDKKPHPNYARFIRWLGTCGKCYLLSDGEKSKADYNADPENTGHPFNG